MATTDWAPEGIEALLRRLDVGVFVGAGVVGLGFVFRGAFCAGFLLQIQVPGLGDPERGWSLPGWTAPAQEAGTRADDARKQLQQAFKEAHDRGLVRIELEIRLAMAEVEKQSASGARAKAQLDSMQKDAQKRNFGLIAQKAAAAEGVLGKRGV